jgi:filamentous hemagglutinin
MTALKNGKVVGQQGKDLTRPIYEVNYEGRTVNVAITTGNNGYVVGANIP